jgi:hypothetical protein
MTLRILAFAATLLAAPAIAFTLGASAQAQNVASFVVANDDGYGVDTCLESGGACGEEVATAWCVANGYVRSTAIRRQTQTDITGKLGGPTQVAAAVDPRAVVITCER